MVMIHTYAKIKVKGQLVEKSGNNGRMDMTYCSTFPTNMVGENM